MACACVGFAVVASGTTPGSTMGLSLGAVPIKTGRKHAHPSSTSSDDSSEEEKSKSSSSSSKADSEASKEAAAAAAGKATDDIRPFIVDVPNVSPSFKHQAFTYRWEAVQVKSS
jgi:hypothetical protein